MRKRLQADDDSVAPATRSELHQWVRDKLHLPTGQEQSLLDAIDSVFLQHERLWQQSKQEAIQAVSAGFTERMNRMRDELSARDATVSSIAQVLRGPRRRPDRSRAPRSEDPADELPPLHRAARGVPRARAARPVVRGRPGRYHLVQVVQRHARSRARRPHHRPRRAAAARAGPVRRPHRAGVAGVRAPARSSTPASAATSSASSFPTSITSAPRWVIAERFREAVERYDWMAEDARLAEKPVNVDVGVVCLRLGPGRRTAPHRPPARARPARPRRRADVRGQGRARQPDLPGPRAASRTARSSSCADDESPGSSVHYHSGSVRRRRHPRRQQRRARARVGRGVRGGGRRRAVRARAALHRHGRRQADARSRRHQRGLTR